MALAMVLGCVSAMAEETRVSRPIWDQMTEKLGRGIANIAFGPLELLIKPYDVANDDGAIPALSPWDILEHYRWGQRPAARASRPAPRPELGPEEEAIVAPLRNEPLSFEELTQITGLSAAKLNSHLTMLELRGIIEKAPGGLYRAYTQIG